MLYKSILLDEYDDDVQRETREFSLYNPKQLVEFVNRNLKPTEILEIGCGSGRSVDYFNITHMLEPNLFRFNKAKAKIGDNIDIKQGVSEAIPWKNDSFSSVLMIGTLGHLRSVYETFIEVNRVLKMNGVFILDSFEGYSGFPGIYPTGENLVDILKDFGFSLIEMRKWKFEGPSAKFFGESVGICVRKFENFDLENLRHLQLIKYGDLYKAVNFQEVKRDWNLI